MKMQEENPDKTSLDELLEWCYDEYDMEPSEEAERVGRMVADLQD